MAAGSGTVQELAAWFGTFLPRGTVAFPIRPAGLNIGKPASQISRRLVVALNFVDAKREAATVARRLD
jgi:hypothetical protein